MTLSTHAIVGAGIAATMPHAPIIGLCAAFVSHFVLDALPHRDYQVRSASLNTKIAAPLEFDATLLRDLLVIGADGLCGLLLGVLLFAGAAPLPLLLGAALAGEFPDALQFAYTRFKHQPLIALQRFHHFVHTRVRMEAQLFLGVASQIAFVAVFVSTIKILAP